MRRSLSLWLPVAAYVAFIFWLSSAPRPAPLLFRWPGADKLVHLGEYTPLGSLLLRAFSRSFSSSRRRFWPAVFLAGLLVGVLDEFYQSFVPTRNSSLWDVSADLIGVTIGQILYSWKSTRTP